MSDIYKGELQDNEGNTIYPHTEADVVFCADGKTMQEKITGMESVTDGVTGRTDSLEVNDSTKLATSAATHKLAENQGGCSLTYNESEDAYYIQHGADSVPKKLGSGGEYVGYYQFEGQANFTPTEDFSWMVIAVNVNYLEPTIEINGVVSWTGNANATIVNKDLTFISKHQGGVDVTKNGDTYSWYSQYKSSVVLLK